MKDHFSEGFSGDYGVDMDAQTLRRLCKIDWVSQSPTWPAMGTLVLEEVIKVHQTVTDPITGYWDQFPYVNSWEILARNPPKWLKECCPKLCQGKKKTKKVLVAVAEVKPPENKKERLAQLRKSIEKAQEEQDKQGQGGETAQKGGFREKTSRKNQFYAEEEILPMPPPYNPVYPALVSGHQGQIQQAQHSPSPSAMGLLPSDPPLPSISQAERTVREDALMRQRQLEEGPVSVTQQADALLDTQVRQEGDFSYLTHPQSLLD